MALSKYEQFLDWNKENIFINLVQAEDHVRHSTELRGEHASCILKHLAYVAGEADEAVSHALELGDAEQSRKFREISASARELMRRVREGSLSEEEAILSIRELRKKLSELAEEFNTEYCESCTIDFKMFSSSREENPYKKEKLINLEILHEEEKKMIDIKYKEYIPFVGGVALGLGLDKLYQKIDIIVGKTESALVEKPSFWLEAITAVAPMLLATRLSGYAKTIAFSAGAFELIMLAINTAIAIQREKLIPSSVKTYTIPSTVTTQTHEAVFSY